MEGENTITVIATNRAGLTMTAAITVRYEPLGGEFNSDDQIAAAIALAISGGG